MGVKDADAERLEKIYDAIFVHWVLEKAVITFVADNFARAADLEIEPDEAPALERYNEVFESERHVFGRNVIECDSRPDSVEERRREGM